jgi:nucleotide-binding universal stress UspA family protein
MQQPSVGKRPTPRPERTGCPSVPLTRAPQVKTAAAYGILAVRDAESAPGASVASPEEGCGFLALATHTRSGRLQGLPIVKSEVSMFTSIVSATDGSERADRALDYATRLARSEGASLHVVHVVETLVSGRGAGQNVFLGESQIDDKIRRQAAALSDEAGGHATMHMTTGRSTHVAEQISEVAANLGADLIVVGTRGHSALVGAVIGSVTQRLLHVAHCAVLAVPPAAAPAVADDLGNTPVTVTVG